MPTINDQGIAVYDMTPEYFGKSMKRLVDLGPPWSADAGTDPSYIKALVKRNSLNFLLPGSYPDRTYVRLCNFISRSGVL